MTYPIYSKKRCRRRDQIGAYDDGGYVYKGRMPPQGDPPGGNSCVGCFDRQGRVYSDLYQRECVGVMKDNGLVYALRPAAGERAEGFADGEGRGWKGAAHNVLGVWAPQGEQRQMAAAAALLLLGKELPAAPKEKRFDLWADVAEFFVDVGLEILDLFT